MVQTEERKKIDAARQALRLAAENPSLKRKTSKAKLVTELRQEIASMKTQGWTWTAIAEALRGSIDASPDTIRRAVATKKKLVPPARPKIEQEKASRARTASTLSGRVPEDRFGPPEL